VDADRQDRTDETDRDRHTETEVEIDIQWQNGFNPNSGSF
jgi:hypothetical protein